MYKDGDYQTWMKTKKKWVCANINDRVFSMLVTLWCGCSLMTRIIEM